MLRKLFDQDWKEVWGELYEYNREESGGQKEDPQQGVEAQHA